MLLPTESHKQSNTEVKLSPNGHTYVCLGNIVGKGEDDHEGQRIWKFALRKSQQHDCPIVNRTETAKVDGEEPIRPQRYPKNCRQLREAGTRRDRLLQGKANNWCQMVILENINTRNILWAEQVIFKNACVFTYIYVHAITISEQGDIEGMQRERWEALEGREG